MKCGPHLASELNKRITIESLSLAKNDSGGAVETWSTFATVWASIEPRLGGERFFAQRIEENISHIIKIRYLSGLETSMRVRFGSRTFQIKSAINQHEDNKLLYLLTMEGTAT
jgi:SPP1 family predicted phage head-tail adaptor